MVIFLMRVINDKSPIVFDGSQVEDFIITETTVRVTEKSSIERGY